MSTGILTQHTPPPHPPVAPPPPHPPTAPAALQVVTPITSCLTDPCVIRETENELTAVNTKTVTAF